MEDPHHPGKLLSHAFAVTRKIQLFVIGRVRFLVKPRCFAIRLLALLEKPPARQTSWEGRIASHKICLYNHFKLLAPHGIVCMFNKIIPAFPHTLETAESGVRCKIEADYT